MVRLPNAMYVPAPEINSSSGIRQKCSQIIQYRKLPLSSLFFTCQSHGLNHMPVWKKSKIKMAMIRSQSRSCLRVDGVRVDSIIFFFELKETGTLPQNTTVFISWKNDF